MLLVGSIYLLTFSFYCSLVISAPSQVRTSWDWSYALRGVDWGEAALPPDGSSARNECGEPEMQSPTNLMDPIGAYGWAYGVPIPFEADRFHNGYTDSEEPSTLIWEGKRLQTKFTARHMQANFVTSQLGVSLYQAPGPTLICKGFHFHTPAEHTMNGQEFELEFHINHKFGETEPFSTVKKSDMAVFFSETKYDKTISAEELDVLDTFFESLNLGGADLIENFHSNVNFKAVMELVDFDDRWILRGSSTAPPCSRIVYRHIFRRVFPISKKNLYFIAKMMERHQEELGGVPLNSRTISPINGHDVYYVGGWRAVLSPKVLYAMLTLSFAIIV